MDDLKGRYPVVLSQDLIWGDMDSYQHINNCIYFRYFEDVRMAYFDKTNILKHKDKTHIGPILASTKCDFRVPLTYPDTIQIATIVGEIEPKRFNMQYVVYSESLKRVAAEGEGLIVYYDYQRERSCEIPEVILSAINRLQLGFEY
ncbi:acyl-CoA thioesterase [Pseudomonadota bacterium]